LGFFVTGIEVQAYLGAAMKVIEKAKGKKAVKVFLLGFVTFLFLVVIFDATFLLLSRMRESSIVVLQLSVRKALEEHTPTVDEPIPARFLPAQTSEGEYYLKAVDIYYYPNAWDCPSCILLKQRVGGFYYLIFGDGAMATVTHWSRFSKDSPVMKPDLIGPTSASKYIFGNFWFIPLGALIIAITIWLTKKFDSS
jgi:hypothetical protein